MSAVVKSNFALKPVVAALALTFSAVNAYAAPTPNQMPGAGQVIGLTPGAATNFGVVGAPITGLVSGATILFGNVANPRLIVQWGGTSAAFPAGVPDATNPAGFNIGAKPFCRPLRYSSKCCTMSFGR